MMLPCILLAALPFVTQIEGGDAGLRGLPGVAVVAEATDPDIRKYGAHQNWLRDHASRALQRGGVPLLTLADGASADRQPLFVIRLQTVRLSNDPWFAWHLNVAVHQKTATLASPAETLLTQTWAATGTLGVSGGRQLVTSVRETLDAKLAEFVKAWRSQRK